MAEPTSSRPAWSGPTDTKTSGIVAEPTTLETEGIGSTKSKKLAQFIATLEMRAGGENFNERAELIRQECVEERSRPAPVMLCGEKPINATPTGEIASVNSSEAEWYGDWQKIAVAVDSGAAETVIPHQ